MTMSFAYSNYLIHHPLVQIFATALVALLISFAFGRFTIKRLQAMQMGQVVRDDGPKSHLSKSGTPTMGGTLILFSIMISALIFGNWSSPVLWIVLGLTLSFGLIGWVDDYRKIVHKNSKGLPARWKYFWQSVLGVGATVLIIFFTKGPHDQLIVPFAHNLHLHLGWGVLVLAYFVIVGSSNAVNLTDGLDGLAILPVVLVAVGLGVFAYLANHSSFAAFFNLTYLPDIGQIPIICAAIVGAGVGFLWFNSYPAQMFMGDVGALALGAILGLIAVIIQQELVLAIMGGIFVVETISVILQVGSYKTRGKRIFKMAPIHHHFELCGWPEPKVIVRFWIVSIILLIITLSSLLS